MGAGNRNAGAAPAPASDAKGIRERYAASLAGALSAVSLFAASLILGYEASWNCVSRCSAGRKPTTPIGCLPGAKKAIVGIDMMLNARDRPGFASTSTFTM